MRHIVNFGLLLSFLTLATTGVLSFLKPFSLVTTRIHIVFGLATMLLVGLHLAVRLKYFRSQLTGFRKQSGNQVTSHALAAIAGCWCLVLLAAFFGWPPTHWMIEQGYEARHKREIVRAAGDTGYLELPQQVLVSRQPAEPNEKTVRLNLQIRFADTYKTIPTIAIWAESTTGSMIETLFLDQSIAFSDRPTWNGSETPRAEILPIWRHRYTLLSGQEPDGGIDTFTGATKSHSFSLDDNLQLGAEQKFVLCLEVNLPADPNEHYQDPQNGQPSLLYTALIETDSEQKYWLLNLTGHGGETADNGAIQYDLDQHTTAKQIVELILAKTSKQGSSKETD